ncbi:MAG: GntR family transcriptional regulator [Planctomycetota bacterium]|nr:GntR family transcriptional regulator [Planctomycetota bacterium]
MLIHLDPTNRVPVYQQLINQVKRHIATGTLKPGDRLPAVRELALLVLVNPNTIQKAYTDLADAGLIHSRKGQGVFVSELRSTLSKDERTRRSVEATDQYITDLLMLGLGLDEVQGLVAARARRFEREEKR